MCLQVSSTALNCTLFALWLPFIQLFVHFLKSMSLYRNLSSKHTLSIGFAGASYLGVVSTRPKATLLYYHDDIREFQACGRFIWHDVFLVTKAPARLLSTKAWHLIIFCWLYYTICAMWKQVNWGELRWIRLHSFALWIPFIQLFVHFLKSTSM